MAEDSRPPLTRRLMAGLGYLLLAPLLGSVGAVRSDPFLRHHRAQALVLALYLAPLVAWGVAGLLGLTHLITSDSFLFDEDPDLAKSCIRGYFLVLAVLALAWALLWLAGMGAALSGSLRRIPYVRGEGSRWLRGVAAAWSALLLIAILGLVAIGQQSSRLARSGGPPAPVYLLFEPRGYEVLGSWGPRMAFYRAAKAATERWGAGSVIVAPFRKEAFAQALRHGRFVVLLVHGSEGVIVGSALTVQLPQGWQPKRVLELVDREGQVERVEEGDGLQLLYNSGCRVGRRGLAWAWQRQLAPAEVVTFDRFSGGLEHLWWIWNEAPRRLRVLPEPSAPLASRMP